MKELISIAFMVVCGIIAYGFFSSKVTAATSPEIMGQAPMSATRSLFECYGSDTVAGSVAINLGSTVNVKVSCGSDSSNNNNIVVKGGDPGTYSQCSSLQVSIGEYYDYSQPGSYCTQYSTTSWGGTYCSKTYTPPPSYTCYVLCAPISATPNITATAPKSNCSWK